MIYNPLTQETAEDKIKAYKDFNNPNDIFFQKENDSDFYDESSIEEEANSLQEDKEIEEIDKAKKEQGRLNDLLTKQPFGQSIVGPLIAQETKIPFKAPRPIVDFTKYDDDEIAQNMISKINFSNYNTADKLYLRVLGARESDYRVGADKGQYKGMFQFNKDSLSAVGINMKDYLNNENVQFQAALKYRDSNLKTLQNYQKFIGTQKDGVLVTRNGLGAMAHLLGPSTVKDYFDGTTKTKLAQKGFRDGNGTHISEYLKMFTQ